MRGVRIPQDLSGEDHFVLGLSVPRLVPLLLGLLGAYTILHLGLPQPIQLTSAFAVAVLGAAVAWIRPEGRSLIHWAVAAIEFKLVERYGSPEPADTRQFVMQAPVVMDRDIRRLPQLKVVGQATDPPPVASPAAVAVSDDDVIELVDGSGGGPDLNSPADFNTSTPAPVYLGGPQVISFFSTKGGTGRTTLATEVAALLALKGQYREGPASRSRPLRVALIDFDLASANVSARLGLAQPTMLDYLCDSSLERRDPQEFTVLHRPTGLEALLGPSKCLAGDRAELLGVAQAAHILSSFKAAGYQFLIVDMSAALGDLETYLLEASTRIFCVVTPTAGSVQSLYRGVEALRRLGLGPKLQYVANKTREGLSLGEAMGDLNGVLSASVPYDAQFDTAENRHEPFVLRNGGLTAAALLQLAASIYPALQLPASNRTGFAPFAWFGRRRRAG